ncbi:MAG: CinA family protein, partial [Oscillospiraceae bacterium]|nr:CinA family protein [Oscillospiraceae bacterium]
MTPFVAEIIAVGGMTEHQLSTLEQNVPTLEKELKFTGIQLSYKSAAGEGHAALKSALIRALDRSDIIFITGGVGMSAGEDTIEYVSKLLGFKIELNEAVLDEMKTMLREREVPYRAEFERAAYMPETGTVLDNDAGIAPGCYLSAGKQCIFIMPSRPLEFKEMFQSSARPLITEFCGDITMSKSIRCFGLTKAQLEDTIPDLLMQEKTTVAVSGNGYDLKIKVSATADNRQNATRECTAMIKTVVDRVGSYIYTADADSLQQLAAEQLKAQNLSVAIAEAGTRGAVMAILSNEQGAWEHITFNFSSTSTRAKEERLELSEKFLRKCEPVSERMSAAMAQAAQKMGSADYGISVVCETIVGDAELNGDLEAFCSVCDGKNVWTRRVVENGRGMTADEMRLLLAQHTLDMLRRVIMARPEKMAGAADVSAVVDGEASAVAVFGSAKNTTAVRTAAAAEEKSSAAPEISAAGIKKYDPTKDDGVSKKKKGKKGKKGKTVGIIVLIVAICVFVGAIGYLVYERLEAEGNKNLVSSLLDLYD